MTHLRIEPLPQEFNRGLVHGRIVWNMLGRIWIALKRWGLEKLSKYRTMNTKIPVKWSNFWNSREMFPLLVDPAIEEDRFMFNDNEVTFFIEPADPTQEGINRLNRQRFFWGFPNMLKKKRSTDS